jgi:hypothetical protein
MCIIVLLKKNDVHLNAVDLQYASIKKAKPLHEYLASLFPIIPRESPGASCPGFISYDNSKQVLGGQTISRARQLIEARRAFPEAET